MTKARLLALPLTLALALAGTSAVMAQDESPAPEEASTSVLDAAEVNEWNEDEALVLYHQIQEKLLLAGVAEEDIPAAMDELAARYGDLDEEDIEDITEFAIASEGISRLEEEIGDGDRFNLRDEEDEESSE